MKKIVILLLCCIVQYTFAQHHNPNPGYWQQQADYVMNVKVDAKNYTYTGTQELKYTNNSPDTLSKVYYHLYFNAFQPGSEMDARLQNISDPDSRMMQAQNNEKGDEIVVSKISLLKPNEIGYLKVNNLKQDGLATTSKVVGTILEVTLAKPILPHTSTLFTLDFEGQAPKMIRRAGRNSDEGVALSMAQWYPKMAEFDFEGWHADPYIGREFHGVWGNFDVKITIDKDYILGGSGILQNKNEIGFGYEDEGVKVVSPKNKKTRTWHFIAQNVHDFTWAAAPDYLHDKHTTADGVTLHFLYKNNPKIIDNWKKLQPETEKILAYYNKLVGKYPYEQYSVIQGGDGGMEYAMCTLITGERSFSSLLSVTAHELAHSWFQHILATNESKHEWMDEGFTSFISDLVVYILEGKDGNPFESTYGNYVYMANLGQNNPLSTHADRYDSNLLYGISAYSKGTVFLTQLSHIIGFDNLMKTLRRYYQDYQFSHPTPNDFKRTAERVTGAVLDWYLVDWTQTTNTVDYGIKSVDVANNQATITLERIGKMPMPIDVMIEYEDESRQFVYIPTTLMRWEKPDEYARVTEIPRIVEKGWGWAHPTYTFTVAIGDKKIRRVVLAGEFMADVDLSNNTYSVK